VKPALVQFGFLAAIAADAVPAARAHAGAEVSLEHFLKEALRTSR